VNAYYGGLYVHKSLAWLWLIVSEPNKLSISLDPTSAQFVQKITNWIGECSGTHEGCTDPMGEERLMPGRLVSVEKDIQLTKPVNTVRFVALSYCWGTSDQPRTTKANVESRCRGFSTSDFPQTLQDAIFLTKRLGLSYIWIDCLCIVQDDEQDWATESAKMADIYSRAYVVLAATQASDVAEGFLHTRKSSTSVFSNCGRKKSITVQARRLRNHERILPGSNLDQYPLSKRGWALQERLLATRIVHFLPDEAVFECRDQFRCECGRASKEYETLTIWPPAANSGLQNEAFGKVDEHDLKFILSWIRVVEEYSKRHLTFADDALPALSGIAQRTLSVHPGQYIAGIWERGLIRQLAWYLHPYPDSEGKKNSVKIPTFSWITAPGSVLFSRLVPDFKPFCVLLSAQSIAATTNPFGRITSAQISVRGPVVEGDIFVRDFTTNMLISARIYLDEGHYFQVKHEGGHLRKETIEQLLSLQDWNTVVCCGLYSMYMGVCVLLLQPAPDTDNYVRIGLAENIDVRWFPKHATERTLTII
jgi:hypothetical protein